MSEELFDQIAEQDKYEEYLQDAITDSFLESCPNRHIDLSLSIGLIDISLEQPGKKYDLCICEASLFDEKEIDEFLSEFKSHLLDLIDLHKISNEKRRKPRKPRFHEGEYSKKYNEEKIANFMKFTFTKIHSLEQLLEDVNSFYDQLKQMDNAIEEIRRK